MIQVHEADGQVRLTGDDYELVVPLGYGPRVVSIRRGDGPNLLFRAPTAGGACCGERAGHRLCVAPERKEVMVDDPHPVELEQVDDIRLVVRGGREARTGLIKELSIEIDDGIIGVTHQIYNTNPWTIELAPWALTVLRPGGWAVAPFPERAIAASGGDLHEPAAPSNPLVMWPNTDLSDPRWRWLPGHFTLRQQNIDGRAPQRIGSFREETWCAYVWNGYVFRKQSQAYPHMDYPDMGCSFELTAGREALELGTMSPLVSLEPGECVRHEEEWTLQPSLEEETGTPERPGPMFCST